MMCGDEFEALYESYEKLEKEKKPSKRMMGENSRISN
jgi:hypothetical protein